MGREGLPKKYRKARGGSRNFIGNADPFIPLAGVTRSKVAKHDVSAIATFPKRVLDVFRRNT